MKMDRVPGDAFIALHFFVTYEWALLGRVFISREPFKPRVMQHSNLLGPFISCKENEGGQSAGRCIYNSSFFRNL